ncbi:MAG: redoxin domain-containing protein [Acidimicrobiales bacterium]
MTDHPTPEDGKASAEDAAPSGAAGDLAAAEDGGRADGGGGGRAEPQQLQASQHRGRRRRLLSLGTGIVLAAVLAAVLFSGIHPSASSPSAGVGDPAPGLNVASANLLGLDVLPPSASTAAPNFHLVDQHGQATSLSQYKGKVVIWSLNDDKCTDLCALFAQDVVAADKDLGTAAKDVVFLSVNANPFYPSSASLRAWSVRNDVESLPNWVYVTGTASQLKRTWDAYHVYVGLDHKTRTVVHDAIVEFIDPTGHRRGVGYFTQGSISTAYYAHAMAQMADDLLPASEQVHVGGTDVSSQTTRGASIGNRAPSFTLPVLGTATSAGLASFEGEPLVLNFWASTCSICVQEMPALQKVDTEFKAKVRFVGVDVADPRSSAASFARSTGVSYPLLADKDGTVAAAYRVDALPVTFIVSPSGTILARHEGTLTEPELVAVLDMDFQDLPQASN